MQSELQRLFDSVEPKVVVLVGTGASFGVTGRGHANWLGLLQHGLAYQLHRGLITPQRHDELRKHVTCAFDPFNLDAVLAHAELVEQNLRLPDPSRYASWLKQSVGTLVADKDRKETLEVLSDLQRAGALIATTNYDSLLCDITGLDPVTWLEPGAMAQISQRSRRGILHLHGHWSEPESVILGTSSYRRIASAVKFQEWFRALWLNFHWIFVGCGPGGLGDPNLGLLLRWAEGWANTGKADFFFARRPDAEKLIADSARPTHLRVIGFERFDELPPLLREVAPASRPAPFVNVHDDAFGGFRPLRASGADLPFPSRAEYLSGDVPRLTVDGEVRRRLDQHGWACVMDRPSTGKTTLGLRLATEVGQRAFPVYYIDCAKHTDYDLARAAEALWRLARQGVLFIVDNVHHGASQVRALWDQWRSMGGTGSYLLLIATEVKTSIALEPTDDLALWVANTENPALRIDLKPTDLAALLRHAQRQIEPMSTAELAPPSDVLSEWHSRYRAALGAFEFALREKWGKLRQCQWDLPADAAASWVRKRWLESCSPREQANLALLSALGAQDLELQCTEAALPERDHINRLVELGLVMLTRRARWGDYGEFKSYSLSEPGWGELFLVALAQVDQQESLLFAAAARDFGFAYLLCIAFHRIGRARQQEKLWQRWLYAPHATAQEWLNFPKLLVSWVVAAERHAPLLVEATMDAAFSAPATFAASALLTPLNDVAAFLDKAKASGRDTTDLWEALEANPSRLVALAWRTPLSSLSVFLEKAKAHGRKLEPLLRALEADPTRLAELACASPLGNLSLLLAKTKAHGLKLEPLLRALEADPSRLVELAWRTPLSDLSAFFDKAKAHRRITALLFQALEADPRRLAELAWRSSLYHIAQFLDKVKAHGRETGTYWAALQAHADGFEQAFASTPLTYARWFFARATESFLAAELSTKDVSIWRSKEHEKDLIGTSWIAKSLMESGLQLHAQELIRVLLRRAQPGDFPALAEGRTAEGFNNAAWLLLSARNEDAAMAKRFLDGVFNRRWLDWHYGKGRIVSLASGLRMLALHPRAIALKQRVMSPVLEQRLQLELGGVMNQDPVRRAAVFQLLGAAFMLGVRADPEWMRSIGPDDVTDLLLKALPHRPDIAYLENNQLQLWWGIRAYERFNPGRAPLRLNRILLEDTRRLCQARAEHSHQDMETRAHELDVGMLRWLDAHLQSSRQRL